MILFDSFEVLHEKGCNDTKEGGGDCEEHDDLPPLWF